MLTSKRHPDEHRRLYLTAGRSTPTNKSLLDAFSALGVEAEHLRPGEAVVRVRPGDTVLGRLDVRPTLDGVEPGLSELRWLGRRGFDVLNAAGSLLAAHDKLETALRLARFGIPHPRTTHVGDDAFPALTPPVVVKPRFGSWGWDVELCETDGELRRTLRLLRRRSWFLRQGALVQELVPSRGRDLRLVVAGGEVVGAVERHAAPGEWRTNVAVGGHRRRVAPPPDAEATALAAAAAVGADLVGVDLLPAPAGGWFVLELNGAVDFTDEYSIDGRDVFAAAAARLLPASQEIFSSDRETSPVCASSSSTMSPLFATP